MWKTYTHQIREERERREREREERACHTHPLQRCVVLKVDGIAELSGEKYRGVGPAPRWISASFTTTPARRWDGGKRPHDVLTKFKEVEVGEWNRDTVLTHLTQVRRDRNAGHTIAVIETAAFRVSAACLLLSSTCVGSPRRSCVRDGWEVHSDVGPPERRVP